MKKHTDTQQLTCVLLLSRWWRKPRLWWKMLRRRWTAWERKEKQTDMCLIWSPSTYSPERGKPEKRTGGRVLCSWDGLARLLVSWSGPVSRNGSPGYKLKIAMTYLTGLLLCCMLGCAGVGDVCHRNDGKVPWANCGFCICWGSDASGLQNWKDWLMQFLFWWRRILLSSARGNFGLCMCIVSQRKHLLADVGRRLAALPCKCKSECQC